MLLQFEETYARQTTIAREKIKTPEKNPSRKKVQPTRTRPPRKENPRIKKVERHEPPSP